VRIDLPQCDFKNCRRCFDGNCNSKMAFRDCQYQQLKEKENLRLDVVSSENGDWHGLYANGRLFFEGDEIPIQKVVGCVYQFFLLIWLNGKSHKQLLKTDFQRISKISEVTVYDECYCLCAMYYRRSTESR